MADDTSNSVTKLLHDAGGGDASAVDRLWDEVYPELRRMAKQQLVGEGPYCKMQTTSLVNEAYLRLVGNAPIEWSNRRHFFSAAARAMRRIRVDDARNRLRIKRGGGKHPDRLLAEPPVEGKEMLQELAVDEALTTLESVDPRRAEIVMLRYYAGLSVDETAAALEVAPRTVDAEWRFARAWLHRELSKGDSTAGSVV